MSNKPEAKQPSPSVPKPEKNVSSKLGCQAVGCKSEPKRHEFCDEHFRQFKFGLINKKGENVSDYDKKYDHYQKWLKSQKVA